MSIIKTTESLCPVCLKRITADIVEIDNHVYMVKKCPEHGEYKTILWRDSSKSYMEWIEYGGTHKNIMLNKTVITEKGCPYDCGICSSHEQSICSAAVMLTDRCNLNCPVCFTRDSGGEKHEPTTEEVKSLIRYYLEQTGQPFPLEFCGGEPTLRDDIFELANYARDIGFDYIQLNTNGIKIAQHPDFAKELKESGITTIYLGFDGVNEYPYKVICGENLVEIKERALENCCKAKIAVVLVPVIIPGINDDQLGQIIQYAKENMPTVKGVFFQPVSYFGHYRRKPENKDRITLPEIMDLIELQTFGEIKRNNFIPSVCEHPMCSFNGFFLLKKDRLVSSTKYGKRNSVDDSADRVRKMTKRNWTYNEKMYLTIGGMYFQDVWNIDLQRLRRCIIGIITKNNGIVPLCAKYLTSESGNKLYEGIS